MSRPPSLIPEQQGHSESSLPSKSPAPTVMVESNFSRKMTGRIFLFGEKDGLSSRRNSLFRSGRRKNSDQALENNKAEGLKAIAKANYDDLFSSIKVAFQAALEMKDVDLILNSLAALGYMNLLYGNWDQALFFYNEHVFIS